VTTTWYNGVTTARLECSDTAGCDAGTYRFSIFYDPVTPPTTCPSTYAEYPITPVLGSPPDTIDVPTHVWICGAAKDMNGNTGYTLTPVQFLVDKVPPVVDVSVVPTVWTNSPPAVTLSCTDDNSTCNPATDIIYDFSTNPGACTGTGNPNPGASFTPTDYGWVCGEAKDMATNIGRSIPREVKYDKFAPIATLASTPFPFVPQFFDLDWTATDLAHPIANSGVDSYTIVYMFVNIDGQPMNAWQILEQANILPTTATSGTINIDVNTWRAGFLLTELEGKNMSFRITVTDDAGNSFTIPEWFNVTLDFTAATCGIASFKDNGGYYGWSLTNPWINETDGDYQVAWWAGDDSGIASYTVTSYDVNDNIEYPVDSDPGTQSGCVNSSLMNATCNQLYWGSYDEVQFWCSATDRAGNPGSDSASLPVRVDEFIPSTTLVAFDPWSGPQKPYWYVDEADCADGCLNLSWTITNEPPDASGVLCTNITYATEKPPGTPVGNLLPVSSPDSPPPLAPPDCLLNADTYFGDDEGMNLSAVGDVDTGQETAYTFLTNAWDFALNMEVMPATLGDGENQVEITKIDTRIPFVNITAIDEKGNVLDNGALPQDSNWVNPIVYAHDNPSGIDKIKITVRKVENDVFVEETLDCTPFGIPDTYEVCAMNISVDPAVESVNLRANATDFAGNYNLSEIVYLGPHSLLEFDVNELFLIMGSSHVANLFVRNVQPIVIAKTSVELSNYPLAGFTGGEGEVGTDFYIYPNRTVLEVYNLNPNEERTFPVEIFSVDPETEGPLILYANGTNDRTDAYGVIDSDYINIFIGYPLSFSGWSDWAVMLFFLLAVGIFFTRVAGRIE